MLSYRHLIEVFEVLLLTAGFLGSIFGVDALSKWLQQYQIGDVQLDNVSFSKYVTWLYYTTTTFIYIIALIVNPIAVYLTMANKKIVWPVSRFIALAFDGRYFHLALKFPYLQLFLPYSIALLLRLGIEFNLQYGTWILYCEDLLISHTAALDIAAYRKLKKHFGNLPRRKNSTLLLSLMLVFASSVYILIILAAQFFQTLAQIFLGTHLATLTTLMVGPNWTFLYLPYNS
ncbi:unnamed protein product, partial [Mesorhabditis spiculigera]